MLHNSRQDNPSEEGIVRIIGINDTNFMVTYVYDARRKNIKIFSEQFKQMSRDVKSIDLLNFYIQNKHKLTDIRIEDDGYY